MSLVPSVTETLLQWGVVPVACTRFCEQPDLVHVGGTKDPDIAGIVGLEPALVVMCDEENRREDADALRSAGLRVHSCSPRSVADVAPALHALADAIGIAMPWSSADGPTTVAEQRGLRAFVPIWRRPWMSLAGDTYGSSVLEAVGLSNVFADHASRYPEVDLDEAKRLRPDVVVAPSEPYPFGARHVEELSRVAPVLLVDGRDLFWWGTRTPVAIDRLRSRIDAFS